MGGAPEWFLLAPPGAERVPRFDAGWVDWPVRATDAANGSDATDVSHATDATDAHNATDGAGGRREAFLSYVRERPSVNWSEELEDLHEQSSRDHFIDVWTRRAMLGWLGPLPERPVLADIGCSTGHLLADLHDAHSDATLLGVDLVAAGLSKAHARTPQARLVQADVCELPLRSGSLDAVLSANLLEHVPEDARALAELARVLRPGARAVIVVPTGPGTYDYYDRFLGHERRYARGELARKARGAGLEVLFDAHLGSLLYAPFWLTTQRNRARFEQLAGELLARRVAADIANTKDSRVGALACVLERWLLGAGVRLPFGIRGLTVLRRRAEGR
jgi:SAM-dependent methyltransferase